MGRLRHAVVWKLLRLPVAALMRLMFNYTYASAPKIQGPFIMVANHVTDFDPLMIGCSFRQHMHFVASEHIFRRGLLSKLLVWLVEPIARTKGAIDTSSAIAILRKLRGRSNVGLFAEGDRSWNGLTGHLHPTTARLIKAAKATLVTYRLTGGYLSSPRWSPFLRRGAMSGRCVSVYTPERISSMSEQELAEAIRRDIYEDAFEAQRISPVRYRGKRLAEGLERALYVCPKCLGVCTMKSRGDTFYCCGCGLSVRFGEYGFFEGEDRPFDTIAEWDFWQESFLREYALRVGEGPIFEDEGQSLYRIEPGHRERFVAEGALRLFRDRLVLGEYNVGLDRISQMGVYGANTVVFSAGGGNYEIRSLTGRSGRKYLQMCQILKGEALCGRRAAAAAACR